MLAINSVIVSILNLIIQVVRFTLFLVIASLFGISWQTDAFFLAQIIPATFINPLISSIQSVYIPTFTQSRIDDPENTGNLVTSTLLIMSILAIVIIILIISLTPIGLRRFGGNLSNDAIQLAYIQTLILSPMVLLQIIISVISSAYNSKSIFITPAVSEVIRYLVTIIMCFILKPIIGINCLPFSFLIGVILQLGILLIFWSKAKIKLILTTQMSSSVVRPILSGIPLLLGSSVIQIGTTITRFLAAQLPSGSITILDYASRLSVGMMELLTSGVMLVVLEDWSKAAANSYSLLAIKMRSSVRIVLLGITPLSIIFIVLRQPIIKIILFRGNFPIESVFLTASIMAIYIASIPIDTIGRFCVRYFLVTKRTKIIGSVAIIRSLTVVAMSWVLLKVLDVKAFAFAELFSILAITLVMGVIIYQISPPIFSGFFIFLLQICGGVIISGLVALSINVKMVAANSIVTIVFVSFGALLSYVIATWCFNILEIRNLFSWLKIKIRINGYRIR